MGQCGQGSKQVKSGALPREVLIKVFRWGNDEEEGGRGGYRGSSSRRKPWDGDFD